MSNIFFARITTAPPQQPAQNTHPCRSQYVTTFLSDVLPNVHSFFFLQNPSDSSAKKYRCGSDAGRLRFTGLPVFTPHISLRMLLNAGSVTSSPGAGLPRFPSPEPDHAYLYIGRIPFPRPWNRDGKQAYPEPHSATFSIIQIPFLH